MNSILQQYSSANFKVPDISGQLQTFGMGLSNKNQKLIVLVVSLPILVGIIFHIPFWVIFGGVALIVATYSWHEGAICTNAPEILRGSISTILPNVPDFFPTVTYQVPVAPPRVYLP